MISWRPWRLGGSISLVVALLGCGSDFEEAACVEGGTDLTYENFGRSFLSRHCQGCHASSAGDRRGAPEGVSFDDQGEVDEWIAHIYDRSAGDNTSMPPGPDDPPEDERDDLAEWLACGAP